MVQPFPSFSAYFLHICRNSCCLLLHFLITAAQSSLLLPCLHHCRYLFYSHNSVALPHSHNSVHPLSPLSVCEISFVIGYVLLNNLSHNSIKLLPSIIHFQTPYCTFQIFFLQPISH